MHIQQKNQQFLTSYFRSRDRNCYKHCSHIYINLISVNCRYGNTCLTKNEQPTSCTFHFMDFKDVFAESMYKNWNGHSILEVHGKVLCSYCIYELSKIAVQVRKQLYILLLHCILNCCLIYLRSCFSISLWTFKHCKRIIFWQRVQFYKRYKRDENVLVYTIRFSMLASLLIFA